MIVGIAARLPNGEVRSLPSPARHCHLSRLYNEACRADGFYAPWEGWDWSEPQFDHSEQGFITDEGKFLGRSEAAEYAFLHGQIRNRTKTLFSEDLW